MFSYSPDPQVIRILSLAAILVGITDRSGLHNWRKIIIGSHVLGTGAHDPHSRPWASRTNKGDRTHSGGQRGGVWSRVFGLVIGKMQRTL